MLIDDDIRQIEQKQEANVAVLKTHKLDEMNKIKDHLQINRFEPQLFSSAQHFTFGRPKSKRIFESDSRVTTLLRVMTQQVNVLIKLCVSCSPKVTSGHLLLIEVVEMALTQMGFILYV